MEVRGAETPEVGFEVTSSAKDGWTTTGDSKDLVQEVFYSRLLYPIEVKSLGIYLVPELDLAVRRSIQPELLSSDDDLNHLMEGMTVYSSSTPTFPAWFIVANHYSDLGFNGSVGSLWEFTVGVSISQLPPDFSSSGKNETYIAFRLRHFPTLDTYLPMIGRTFFLSPDLNLNIEIPIQITLDWKSPSRDWLLSGGGRFRDAEYAVLNSALPGWLEGYSTELFVGAAYRIFQSQYLSFEMGMQSMSLNLLPANGAETQSYNGNFSPWIRAAFGFKFPKENI